jgi:DNA-binding transcriptional MerR regulator
MNNIKTNFSIKDLENLSGIKAHTIRIWEKRYKLLQPNRTDSNIRYYDLGNLQKLLNITLLYNNGFKISKISEIEETEISGVVRDFVAKKSVKSHAVSAFKLAMINFDQDLFDSTYNDLLKEKTFKEIFHQVFIPLLHELGILWQTATILPTHEHFISGLIKHKILISTELITKEVPKKQDKTFVLYLPENEIHEIGLLYLNYEIVLSGYKTIYLGPSLPVDNLIEPASYFSNIHYVSYFTVAPNATKINKYLKEFNEKVISKTGSTLWLLGNQTKLIEPRMISNKIKIFQSISQLTDIL